MKKLIIVFVFFCFIVCCNENAQQARDFKGFPVEVGIYGEKGLPVELQVQQDRKIPVELQVPDNQHIPVKMVTPVEVKIQDDQSLAVKFDAQNAIPVKMEIPKNVLTIIITAAVAFFVILVIICAAMVSLARSSRSNRK